MIDSNFTVNEVPDYHPTELGFDWGENVNEFYGNFLNTLDLNGGYAGEFAEGSVEEEFLNPISKGRTLVLNPKREARDKNVKQGFQLSPEELKELDMPDVDYNMEGVERAYRMSVSVSRRDSCRTSGNTMNKDSKRRLRKYKRIVRNLRRFL